MITIIFCVLDDFCKEFERENKKCFIETLATNKRARSATLTASEILTILVFFHHSKQRIFKSYIDSTILRVCHNNRIFQNKVFKGVAQRSHSSMGWFYDFKFHYVINTEGQIVRFSAPLFKKLFKRDLQIVTKIKRNMKNVLVDFTNKILLRKRGVVESVGNLLKNSMQMERSRHRSVIGFFINVLAVVVAYNFLLCARFINFSQSN